MFKNYVSEIDQCLEAFDKQRPQLSRSQQQEQIKHKRISQLRDSLEKTNRVTDLWDTF